VDPTLPTFPAMLRSSNASYARASQYDMLCGLCAASLLSYFLFVFGAAAAIGESAGCVCCVLRAACCVLRAACCVLRAACCVLRAACCVLRAACCVLRAACYVPRISCCSPPRSVSLRRSRAGHPGAGGGGAPRQLRYQVGQGGIDPRAKHPLGACVLPELCTLLCALPRTIAGQLAVHVVQSGPRHRRRTAVSQRCSARARCSWRSV